MAFSKTDAGRDEIQSRSRKLATGLRSLLLMVDGQRSADELRALIATFHAPADALEQLAQLGLIADGMQARSVPAAEALPVQAVDAQRYNTLYTLMSESIRAHLGLKGYFVQLKVERCADAHELQAALPEVAKAIGKIKGQDFSDHWLESVRGAVA